VWKWARVGVGPYSYCSSMAVDSAGNVYATGSFQEFLAFGRDTLLGTSKSEVFLAKFDSLGSLEWAIGDATELYYGGANIAVDRLGNCYLSGYIGSDIFIRKYDSKGTIQWTRLG